MLYNYHNYQLLISEHLNNTFMYPGGLDFFYGIFQPFELNLEAVLRIRNKSFGSGFGSGSGLKLVSDSDPDSNPDSNPGFKSGSGSRIRIYIRNWPKLLFWYKFLPSLIFKHKKVAFPHWLRTRCARKARVRGSGFVPKSHGSTTLRTTTCKCFLLYSDCCYYL
jgi:hypothetical protein